MKTSSSETVIYVFADWYALGNCIPLGILRAQPVRGKEIFSFEYSKEWLQHEQALFLDPDLGLFQGQQFLPENKPNFGLFLDSSPDRWGRMLMKRRESLLAKSENRDEKRLLESDFLLGVFDQHRMGGLRFKLHPDGEFLDNHVHMASPPWTSLRDLEFASLQIEQDNAVNNPEYANWINMLIHPGSSLGGARPKSGVIDNQGNLWIAKFPSRFDEKDSGAWEFVLNRLAAQCGISVPEAQLLKFTGKHHTFLSKRFDRAGLNQRIHFSSAMTLLGCYDGADNSDGVSYLEMASFIIRHSAAIVNDLEQLWRRILFNILVSNTDDHLRNHGFLLTNSGWRLSPAFDMNPNEYGTGLHLNIDETSNDLDISLAIIVAKYFRLSPDHANNIVREMKKVLINWKSLATKAGISADEIQLIEKAFRRI